MNKHPPAVTDRFRPLFAALILLMPGAGTTVLHAQAAKGKAKVQFSCMMWESLPAEELYYRDGESYLPLEFTLSKRSQSYPLKRSEAFEMFRRVATPEEEEPAYQLVGKAPLTAGAERMLFLIFEAQDAPVPGYKVLGIDDSLDTFPAGTFRFVNFSSAQLLVKFGGKVEKIPPREMTLIKSNAPRQGAFLPFIIGDSQGKVVFETRLFGQPAGREFVFISPPAREGGPPLVKFLPQIIPPEPPKAPR